MANYLVTDTKLTAVAESIRTKGGLEDTLVFPDGFVSAVEAITSDREKVTAIDYSALAEGTFTETLESGQTVSYTVTTDESGQVTAISNGTHTVGVTW